MSNLSKGDKFKIKNGIPSIHWYKPEEWYTFHSYCNDNEAVVTQEDVDAGYRIGEVWVEIEHIDFSSIVKTSSEALQDILKEKDTEVLVKEENGLESNTGASVNISVLVSVQGNNYQLTRDQAYKLWEDLTEIFEEKIV